MKLAIAGASGRMGHMLIDAALAQPDVQIAVALDRPDSPMLGRDCAENLGRTTGAPSAPTSPRLDGGRRADRFHSPEATLKHLHACIDGRCARW